MGVQIRMYAVHSEYEIQIRMYAVHSEYEVQVRMYAVHSEYEVVVFEESSAKRYRRQRVALLLRRGVWGSPP